MNHPHERSPARSISPRARRLVLLALGLVAACTHRFPPTATGTELARWSGRWTGYAPSDAPPFSRDAMVRLLLHAQPVDIGVHIEGVGGEVRTLRAVLRDNPDGWRVSSPAPSQNMGIPRIGSQGWVAVLFEVVLAHESAAFRGNRGPDVNVGPLLVMRDGSFDAASDEPVAPCNGRDRLADSETVQSQLCLLAP